MQPVLLLSADDALISRIRDVVTDAGHDLGIANNWSRVVQEVIGGGAHAILVDANAPGASGPLLAALSETTGVPMRAVAAPLPPLPHADDAGDLRRWLAVSGRPTLSVSERYRLELAGLADAEATVLNLASAARPIAWLAEPGSSVLWLSRLVDRLSGRRASSIVLAPTDQAPDGYEVSRIVPLRERPGDLRPLLRYFLEQQRQRLGLPWLRASPELYAAVEAHPWPGNEAELEAFAVQAAPHGGGSSIRLDDLPERVRDLLAPGRGLEVSTASYERIAEAWIRPIVQHYQPGGPSLYRRVIDATESALIRAAYERAGSQLAASKLLGVARNTLRAREAKLKVRP